MDGEERSSCSHAVQHAHSRSACDSIVELMTQQACQGVAVHATGTGSQCKITAPVQP